MRSIEHFIGGQTVVGTSGRHSDVFDPNSGQVQAKVSLANAAELDRAVRNAAEAQPAWAAVNPQRRARVMFEFVRLLNAHKQELAELLASEHGKVVSDAHGDVLRGLEVIEFACGIRHLLKGEYTQGAGPRIDVYSAMQPLGVVAGVTPFNFPAMIPMWMFGPAIATGNAFILKPSERDPSVPVRLAELMIEAGLPPGILNVVHGDKEIVDAIVAHPTIKAVSFVGSSDVAQSVYAAGAAHDVEPQRVQAARGRYALVDGAFGVRLVAQRGRQVAQQQPQRAARAQRGLHRRGALSEPVTEREQRGGQIGRQLVQRSRVDAARQLAGRGRAGGVEDRHVQPLQALVGGQHPRLQLVQREIGARVHGKLCGSGFIVAASNAGPVWPHTVARRLRRS